MKEQERGRRARIAGFVALLWAAAPSWAAGPPVAIDDVVRLPVDGLQVLVDVLANDLEPDGELLSITLAGHCLRIAGSPVVVGTTTVTSDGYFLSFVTPQPLQDGDGGGLSEACAVTYTVSDESMRPASAGRSTPASSRPTSTTLVEE